MNPIILDYFTQIKELYPQQELVEFHQKFKDDDELEKIIQQTKIAKSQFESTEDKSTLINQLSNIINETKIAYKESLLSTKKFEIVQSQKEKVVYEYTRLKNFIPILEDYRDTQNSELDYLQEFYNIATKEEQQKTESFVEGIQKEFQVVLLELEEASKMKQQNQIENEDLKEKLKFKQTQVEQRSQHCDEEIMKLESYRKERLNQIYQQINYINQKLGEDEDDYSGLLEILKQEEDLIDKHLNPYIQKDYEYTQIIEKSNKLCNLYQSETEKLKQQCHEYLQKSQQNQRIVEKSDIFIVEQIKEYQVLMQLLKQKQEQKLQLENLKSNLLNKLL